MPGLLRLINANLRHRAFKSGTVSIGNVKAKVRDAKHVELVPHGFAKDGSKLGVNAHLKWLFQKDNLKQDVFLLGKPGFLRSSVVLQYLELCNREFEYLAVTRDTTENDIKQRREVQGGSIKYSDLCAVRAAVNGRILVLEGIENAERNVLPILNNLLENREMQLECGTFLMSASKYDKLRKDYSEQELKEMKLERVHPDFSVIALGLPVPQFKGQLLDVPFRSRFQCKTVDSLTYEKLNSIITTTYTNIDETKLKAVLSVAYTLNMSKDDPSKIIDLPLFPIDSILKVSQLWNNNPELSAYQILETCYPSTVILKTKQKTVYSDYLESFGVSTKLDEGPLDKLNKSSDSFISTISNENLLARMKETYQELDFCLLGEKGSGKTTLLLELAKRVKSEVTSLVLYQDINSRDLIQERRILENGDTAWEDSLLVKACKKGDIFILDGIERVHSSCLEMLSSLIHHRFLNLPNGERLISHESFENLIKNGISKQVLMENKIYRISKKFRLLAVGDSSTAPKWLNEQILSLFKFHCLSPTHLQEQCDIVERLVPDCNKNISQKLFKLVNALHNSNDPALKNVAESLSLRKLINILKRQTLYPEESIIDAIHSATLFKFLPPVTKTAFNSMIKSVGFQQTTKKLVYDNSGLAPHSLQLSQPDSLAIPVSEALSKEQLTMVPDIVFYDNQQHLKIINDMMHDFQLNNHILLIGAQGVGKNKTVDRFLQLTNRPRYYIQLHRDSTIQSLTVQSTIEGGILKYSDSPLVQAIKTGAVICIDEADKAPLHVISVLKSLLDTGVLYLSDGRKIIPKGYPFTDKNEIETHPDFRIIMLANKIGYPFQGHDLFKLLGDLLAVNLVVNPSPESQIAMLKQYGPDVPDVSIHKLVACFDDLREKYDNSQISYPYSLRELVHIIKHLQLYPDEALSSVVKNVFDFDVFSKDAMHHIQETFHKHGIPLGIAFPRKFFFAKRHSLNEFKSYGHMEYKTLPTNFVTSKVNKLFYASKESVVDEMQHDIEMTNTRMSSFTEQENCWTIPLDRGNMVSSIIQLKNAYKTIAVATVNPPALYLLKDSETSKAGVVSISEYFRHQGPNIRITLSPYPGQDNKILLHEEVSNEILTFDVKTQQIRSLALQVNTFAGELFNKIKGKSAERHWRLLPATDNALPLFYELNGKEIKILDTKNEQTNVLSFGNEDFSVQNVSYFGKNTWLVQSKDKCYELAKIKEAYQLREIKSKFFDTQILSGNCLSDQKLLTSNNFYSIKSIDNQIKAIPRPKGQQMVKDKIPYRHTQNMHSFVDLGKTSVVLDNNLIVNLQPLWYTQKSLFPELTKPEDYDSALEVIDVDRGTIQCIPIPKHYDLTDYYNWKTDLSATNAFITPTASGDGIFVCDISGHIRKLQLNEVSLENSLSKWSDMFEKSDQEERLHFNKDDYDMSKLRDDPRHGKVDPNNAPHTGGNTWHGGTGGYSTAGLGGIGGPYRLDAGHNITQLNEEAKLKVPEEVRKKAREMNRREYAKKLEEINMSEHDAAAYNTLKSRIENEASSLRKILLELDAKQKDMSWTRNQTQGDFDDAKLVEAITGEKNIYKRRLEAEPGAALEEPKRLRVIFDLSGSIYRFNGMDGRLQRSLETALLVMTSLADQEKIVFDVFGHSGDGFKEKLVNKNEYKQENEQLKVIKKMLTHTQFCNSGDTTVEALEFHINELAEEGDYDEKFVILFSDANFQRYGIRPEEVAAHLNNDANVSSFLILIGSLGNEAEKLQTLLPSGKCFIAKDSKELPKILQSIFLSTVLK